MPRIVVCGLGPAGPDLLTAATTTAIAAHPIRFVRTRRHPAAEAVADAESFDAIYDDADTMDEVYGRIVDRLVEAAQVHGTVLYAVPGSPVVAEHTVELLVGRTDVDVELVPALSFVDLAWVRLGVDPVAVGARIIDGHRFDEELGTSRGALLVAQCDRPDVLAAIKLAVGEAVDRAADRAAAADVHPQPVVLRHLGGPDEQVEPVAWFDLDRIPCDHLTSVWVPPMGVTVGSAMDRVNDVVVTLRRQCPWDREQTHGTLRPHLLEEAHEVLEVLDQLDLLDSAEPARTDADADADADAAADVDADANDLYGHLAEELGDLLFQVLLHAAIAAEDGHFTLTEVADGLHDKLRLRHPHVFGDAEVADADEVARRWDQAKRAEKGRASVFDGIPAGLPALAQAAKVLRRAQSLGADAVPAPTRLDLAGSGDVADPGDPAGEVGVALLVLVDEARRAGIDPESALRTATARYQALARQVEADAPTGP